MRTPDGRVRTRCTATQVEEHHLDQALFEAAVAWHYERTQPADQPPFPGVKEICEHICGAGGQNVIVTHRGPQGTAELLDASGLSGLFSGCITAADAFPRKPDPAAFNEIIERHGLVRDETMAIGDRDIDVLAGKSAGLYTCFFGPENSEVDADLRIADFGELARLLAAPDRHLARRTRGLRSAAGQRAVPSRQPAHWPPIDRWLRSTAKPRLCCNASTTTAASSAGISQVVPHDLQCR